MPHCPLPPELKCEILVFLPIREQKRLVIDLGNHAIHELCGKKIKAKVDKLRELSWNLPPTIVIKRFPEGQQMWCSSACAKMPFKIVGAERKVYYYELKFLQSEHSEHSMTRYFGLATRDPYLPGTYPSSFNGLLFVFSCFYSDLHYMNSQTRQYCGMSIKGVINSRDRPVKGDIYGCGFVPTKRAIFFTKNGHKFSVFYILNDTFDDNLYPFVEHYDANHLFEANFGGQPVGNPFKFDIDQMNLDSESYYL